MSIRYKAFISYRRNSSVNAYYVLKSIIDNSGYSKDDIFLDEQSIGPEHFDKKIKYAIENSNCIVLLVTKNCFIPRDEEDWFLKEIKTALENKKTIIPVLFDEIKTISDNLPSDIIEGFLNKDEISNLGYFQCVQFSQEYPTESIKKLVSFIEKKEEDKESCFEKIKKWSKRISIMVAFFILFFTLCFGIGFMWGYFTSPTATADVIADNTMIVDKTLLFNYAGLKATYNLETDKIDIDDVNVHKEIPKLERSEILLSSFTFTGIYSITERNLYSLKYLRFLKNGSKPAKIAMVCAGAAICLGSVCGFSEGSYFGKTLKQQESVLALYPKLKNKSSWLPAISNNKLLMLKYKQNLIANTKGYFIMASPIDSGCIAYQKGLIQPCVLLEYNNWNIKNGTFNSLTDEIDKCRKKPKIAAFLNIQDMHIFKCIFPSGTVGMNVKLVDGNYNDLYKTAINKYEEWKLQTLEIYDRPRNHIFPYRP